MADYYSILEKTISGLPNNSPEVRTAVYKKARTAIETQLRNMDPTPSEEAIASQLKLLEEAIVVIDSEYAPESEPLPVLDEEPPQAELPPEPEAVSSIAGDPLSTSPTTESVVDRVETAIDKIQTDEAYLADTSDNASGIAPVAVDPATKDILEPIVTADPSLAQSSELDVDEKESGGFFSGLIKLLVILGLLGGAGYAVWKNKDELTDFANNLMAPAEVAEETAPTTEPVEATTEPEEEVIEEPAPEPETVEPEPVEPEVVEPEVTEPEVVEPEITEPEVVEPEVTEPETTEEPTDEETPSTSEQSGVIPIGEVAYLYEEGTAGSGATRTNAAVTWEIQQQSLNENIPPEPVIIGKMDIPEKGVSIDIVIKRNIDAAVSASHMVEMKFNLPADFSGKSIESIARFVMKATEEAPGEPLAAVPVKVSEGNFLIALDNLTQAVALNTQLLRGSSWIDVPVVYGTGKRALLTLEKGGTGQRVFDEALNDWQNR